MSSLARITLATERLSSITSPTLSALALYRTATYHQYLQGGAVQFYSNFSHWRKVAAEILTEKNGFKEINICEYTHEVKSHIHNIYGQLSDYSKLKESRRSDSYLALIEPSPLSLISSVNKRGVKLGELDKLEVALGDKYVKGFKYVVIAPGADKKAKDSVLKLVEPITSDLQNPVIITDPGNEVDRVNYISEWDSNTIVVCTTDSALDFATKMFPKFHNIYSIKKEMDLTRSHTHKLTPARGALYE